MDDSQNTVRESVLETDEVSRFAESYASFNRILNSLQRKYIQLEEEFTAQHRELAEANRKLVKLTEHNLAVTEFLNSIINSISAGVIAVDRRGIITHFNKAAARILGIPVREPLGKPYRECIPPGAPPDANCLRSAEKGEALDSVERVVAQSDNSRLHLSVSTAVLRGTHGEPTGAVEVLHDLTKVKKMEHELARLNTLAALGEMAATIAHEVRNPIAGIGGFAALLLKDFDEDDPRRKLVNNIIRGVDSLNGTVTTLLNYTRFEETNKAPVSFDDFIVSAVKQFERDNLERLAGAEIVFLRPDKTSGINPKVEIDAMLLRQAFFNLFTNALDVTEETGRIELSYRVHPRQAATGRFGERMLIGLDETVVETTVTDCGPGIPDEHVERIFSPFFTTRSAGNGLGLAVAWKAMKAHGGDIIAENRPEGGACFRLLLPVKLDAVTWEH